MRKYGKKSEYWKCGRHHTDASDHLWNSRAGSTKTMTPKEKPHHPSITETVIEQFWQLEGRRINMKDTPTVYREAKRLGYHEIADLTENDLHAYLEILSRPKFYKRNKKRRRRS
jgi:hypothetical protein